MNFMKHLIIISLLMLCALSLNAQDTTKSKIKYLSASGKVVDEKGNPILGATIRIEGTTNGAKAKPNGDFVVKNIPFFDTLTIRASAIGYYETKQKFNNAQIEDLRIVLKIKQIDTSKEFYIIDPIPIRRFYNDDVGTIRRIEHWELVK